MRSLAEINKDRDRLRSKRFDLMAEADGIESKRHTYGWTDGLAQRASRLVAGIENVERDMALIDEEAAAASWRWSNPAKR